MKTETEVRALFDHMDRMIDRIIDLSDNSTETNRPMSIETATAIQKGFSLLQASLPVLVWILDMEEGMKEKYGDIPESRCTVSDFMAHGEQCISKAYKEMEDNAGLTRKGR